MSDKFKKSSGRIFLTGMMGAGKSTTGRLLASKLECEYLDTDQLIEERHGPISRIFEMEGEQVFRQIETRLLEEITGLTDVVVSTGGGMACHAENGRVMIENGFVVYLKCSLDTLMERLQSERKNRPLIASGSLRTSLESLLKQRSECYEKADLIVDAESMPRQIVDLIIAGLQSEVS